MIKQLSTLLFVLVACTTVRAQTTLPGPAPLPAQPTLPSPEEFVNAVVHTVADSSFSPYYLIAGADTCRFVRYDYDEWAKYHLQEPMPISTLNELAEKVYLSRYPYFWKQARLRNAICIGRREADSILSFNPAFGDDSTRSPRQRKKGYRKRLEQWERLPARQKTIFSFSLPQFTDDGQYAVIDLNMVCGPRCGLGCTYIFHHTKSGWKQIGEYRNWSA